MTGGGAECTCAAGDSEEDSVSGRSQCTEAGGQHPALLRETAQTRTQPSAGAQTQAGETKSRITQVS